MSSESHSPETFNFASNAEGAAGQDLAQAETVFEVRTGDAAESDRARSTRGAVTTTAENTLDASRSRGYPAYGEESDGLAIGMTLDGKYEISALIGAGGMGSVYRARHLTLNRDVAVKVIKRNFAGDRDALERFQREAQLCALIEHPNSVRVFDYGVQGNVCFLVMEFLRGETLRERLAKRGRPPLPEAVAIADRMLQVLSVLDRKGVIHRDLKPDNIFFSHQAEAEGEAEAEVVKLIDFGIAKQSRRKRARPSRAPAPSSARRFTCRLSSAKGGRWTAAPTSSGMADCVALRSGRTSDVREGPRRARQTRRAAAERVKRPSFSRRGRFPR